jgi:chromosome segregation ATPase
MAERSEWHHHNDHDDAQPLDDAPHVDERVRLAEDRARTADEQRLQVEGRCFAAERRRLDAERRLEQVEALLEEALQAGARMRGLVGELSEMAGSLRRALESSAAESARPSGEDTVAAEHRAEMVDALASAVERLRARVDEVKAVEPESDAAQSESDEIAGGPALAEPQPAVARQSHKHSMSAITRWRNRRKQRQST